MNYNSEKNDIISKLSNCLKLPKAQRWICCEWFYSDIDKVIFDSENDFSICLKQSFQQLSRKKLRRKQWFIIRSLIGKPRRCSDVFFQEERNMLEEKRQKIRLIQQRKVGEKEALDVKDLPNEIPVTLSIGHRVYSHISQPEEGVFLGTVAAIDIVEHTYRIVFDRQSIGSQTVHDYEIKSVQPVQTIPIKAYLQIYRPKINKKITKNLQILHNTSQNFYENINSPRFNSMYIEDLNTINASHQSIATALIVTDPMISLFSPLKLRNDFNTHIQTPLLNTFGISSSTNKLKTEHNIGGLDNNGILGGFPLHLLLIVTRLNKILNIKRDYIKKLNLMNNSAEKNKAKNFTLGKEFQMDYAVIILDLEKLNKDLGYYLIGIQNYCEELSTDFRFLINTRNSKINYTDKIEKNQEITILHDYEKKSIAEYLSFTNIDEIKKHFYNESLYLIRKLFLVRKTNFTNFSENVFNDNNFKSKTSIELIAKLISLLVQLKNYANLSEKNNVSLLLFYSFKVLANSMNDIKKSISQPKSLKLFQENSLVQLNHLQTLLAKYSKLNAFKFEINPNYVKINQKINFKEH